MGINSYFLKFVKATYISRRRSEMKRTIENLKRNISVYNNYCCKNIIYHTYETPDVFKNEFHVYLDDNVLKVLEFINCVNLNKATVTNEEKENSENHTFRNLQNTSYFNNNNINNNNNNNINNNINNSTNTDITINTTNISNSNNSTNNADTNYRTKQNTYILNYKINDILCKREKREQYRYTYLKSPFKYKYALRHYVFEKYKYTFYFYNITHFNINIIFNIILSSLTSNTSVKCNINWFYPGERLFDSSFFKNTFDLLIKKKRESEQTTKNQTYQIYQRNQRNQTNGNIKEKLIKNEIENEIKKEKEKEKECTNLHFYNYNDLNLDLSKCNIQDILPLFFENKIFNDNYKKQILLEEKSFKQMKNKLKKKNVHWFLNKSPNI